MCEHQLEQYHGVFTCRNCKEIVFDFSDICKVTQEEKKAREEATDLTKEEK